MRLSKLLLIPLGIVTLCIFIAISRHRFIDGDEGFYLLASRLVFQHKLPYVDFFYQQAPLLPYVYGLWMLVTGESWLSARLLSAILTAALAILVYVEVCNRTRKPAAGLLALLLFTTNSLVFAWMPIAKTFGLSSLLLFSCYLIASRFSARSSKVAFALAALLFGLSVEVRMFLIAVLPVLLASILRNPEIREKKAAICYFAAGFAVAMLPTFYLLCVNPASYVFDNLGYHAIRTGNGLIGNFGQKVAVVLGVTILPSPGDGPQLGLLCIAGLVAMRKVRTTAHVTLALQIAAVLSLVSLLPTPTFMQYFSVVVPFLIVGAVCAVDDLLRVVDRKRARILAITGLAALAIYFVAPISDYRALALNGSALGVTGEGAANWNPKTVLTVSKLVDQLAAPGEEVMSFWPGYLLGTKAIPFSGFENDFGLECAPRVAQTQRSKYRILSQSQIDAQIAARIPRIVVLGNQEYLKQPKGPYAAVLLQSGYHVVAVVGDTSVYTL